MIAEPRETYMVLFSRSHDSLPAETLQRFRDEGAPAPRITWGGTKYSYRWRDIKLALTVLSPLEKMCKIGGTQQFVCLIYEGRVPKRGRKLIARLEETRLAIAFELIPLIEDIRIARFYTRLCRDLDPLSFFETSFYDSKNRAYLNIDRTFDRNANID